MKNIKREILESVQMRTNNENNKDRMQNIGGLMIYTFIVLLCRCIHCVVVQMHSLCCCADAFMYNTYKSHMHVGWTSEKEFFCC